MKSLVEIITSRDPEIRNISLRKICRSLDTRALLAACDDLENFRKTSDNLYERVRAALFLYAAHRFFLMDSTDISATGAIPPEGREDLLGRRFEQAIACFRRRMERDGANGALCSALAEGYRHLSFQTLADQVRRSVRASRGNQWMFRVGHAEDHPVRIRKELLERPEGSLLYPILEESTPVRLDLSHSGWSDIFFLGMDYPEGARVLNISVDLGVYGRDKTVRPPVCSFVRVIPEPLLRLTSVDLQCTKDITSLADLFNFGNDYLSLLKAGVIASGFIPPSFEGTNQPVSQILARIISPGMGLELVSMVNDIPKGSRLAVSTTLLASIVSVLMRATGQTASLEGGLEESERRQVASRAILGEWLGGSGGGWQDSGGIWPGFKVIEGTAAREGDPEFGISNGCLLPRHRILGEESLHPEIIERLTGSLVAIHGGMAQNVGPILEMVTEKYLLREEAEWKARLSMREIFDNILSTLKSGDIRALAENTMRNWEYPLPAIIPYVTNHFTETIIARSREKLGADFWGFLMLGGMSGGGMAMFVAPNRKDDFCDDILSIMRSSKQTLEDALPFAIDPIVYNFGVNQSGTRSKMLKGGGALLPARYYALQVPEMVRQKPETICYLRRAELDHFTAKQSGAAESYSMLRTVVSNLFRVADPASQEERLAWDAGAERIRIENGFDSIQHEKIREDLLSGRIGLARNRLPVNTDIEDVRPEDVSLLNGDKKLARLGEDELRSGRVATMTLAAGMGTRWTSGAGVVKAINPFIKIAGRHRSFLEIHLAKTRRTSKLFNTHIPHIVSTSYLTHAPIKKHLSLNDNYGYEGPLYLSPGRSISQRLVPMARDLTFLWEEMPQETLDEQKQKVRESGRKALMDWARACGEGSDYVDNVPLQRFNPPGHWYEVSNLMRNGVLARILEMNPNIQTIMMHNIDTLGADISPEALGAHRASGSVLTFEVVPRRLWDRGGGLARINGQVRLLEGLAQPRDEDELKLIYYNTMTTWIEIDPLLEIFGLTRNDLAGSEEKIAEAIRRMAQRVPTYVTIKDVKRRWGHGQEDIYPVAQFEKLWSDMTSLADIPCGYLVAPRQRGQQIKSPDELDPWVNDGSRDYVAGLCDFVGG
ncbi:MAG TPA: UTP--glucose-1-phosphate uridylyltransferase [Candidatus Sumerlaeota bacterium]|nr:UTP--glucose-1-phosphate uridylyltransferase [Candidatus Sumerlaeota bacterium]HON50503.1 UTP--glucose-1-phosphate uridylyltransferase [Candidatus Sumerlaeota bacterium]HOR63718.1 UTP--glucose-1-phosphate uridylyltransferase [Candidatus Sumerlaeota bacterium]HPL73686.1 UTP--glucose-1-phosphate uridylyltransferase [Candidatus Sumerlaeota bacterium]